MQSNWLPLPQQGDHNARQDPLNTIVRRWTVDNMKMPRRDLPQDHVSSNTGTESSSKVEMLQFVICVDV